MFRGFGSPSQGAGTERAWQHQHSRILLLCRYPRPRTTARYADIPLWWVVAVRSSAVGKALRMDQWLAMAGKVATQPPTFAWRQQYLLGGFLIDNICTRFGNIYTPTYDSVRVKQGAGN